MNTSLDLLLVLLFLTNLKLLGSSRLGASIRVVALQGVVLGLLPFTIHSLTFYTLFFAAGSVVLKSYIFPRLLFRALRDARVRREVEPFVGYTASLLIGLVLLGVSLGLGSRLPLPTAHTSPLVLPVALYTILVGLFLIVSRQKAISQVLGYLVLENGIYAFGVALDLQEAFVVELGVLLDIFVAVFVMGIIIFHINREFDSIDSEELSSLRDWT